MQRALVALVSAAVGLTICMVLASCGSGNEELTKTAFVKKAEAICADVRKQVRTELDSESLASSGASILHTEADEIDSLEGPSNDADQIDAIVEATRKAADTLKANEKEPDKADASVAKADRLAEAYGLGSCPLY
jgi:hypothetical protein